MAWTLTPYGREVLLEMVAAGLNYDLAVTVLHREVEAGTYAEAEIYEVPEIDEEIIILGGV